MIRNSSSGHPAGLSSSSDLACRIKYQNNLPDIPFDPKFISYPFDPNRFIQFNSTTLEKNFKWDILNEQDLGVRIDLINQDYNRIDPDAKLHPTDEKLLEEENSTAAADLKRNEQHLKTVSWMRRNEYISTENTRFQPKQYDAAEAKVGYSIKRKTKEYEFYKDRESQIEAIERSFQAAKKPIEKHYSKANVYPVQEMQIFPDFDLWRHPCVQVIFDDDPAPKDHSTTLQNEEMSQALIKGMNDEKTGEMFVGYFLPTDDTIKKRRRDEEAELDYDADDEYDFKLAREYTWNIKSKVNRGYEENFYFIFKEDGVFYNELDTRVRLSKRRTKAGKISNTRFIVKYRDYNKQELKQQRLRAKDLELYDENEEEDEEDEDEDEEGEEEEEEQQIEENSQENHDEENSQNDDENVDVDEENEEEEEEDDDDEKEEEDENNSD